MQPPFLQNSLVLYKTYPARVIIYNGDKLDIELEDGKNLKVRPKDITLLHPGPLRSLTELQPQHGDVETAWELLAGTTTTLADLAELIYDACTPATTWATWQLVADGLYFSGQPEAIEVSTPAKMTQTQADRALKTARETEWAAFMGRVKSGKIVAADSVHLAEVELVALGQQDKSRVLRELFRPQNRENAHTLLLNLGYWDETMNPYPQRLGVALSQPAIALPELPAENRQDLTHLPAFAIDDEGSSDPDDALSLAGNRLWVHIADVAALVSPNSPADLEARGRGANLYLPEGTISMLPPEATSRLALGLADVSPALSFGLEIDTAGNPTLVELTPSWVKVQRLTYETVESRLNEAPFLTLYQLAQTAMARRQTRGAVELNLPEVKIQVVNGEVIIKPLPPLKSRDLVREAMLLTGEATARYAQANGLPIPFTTQEPADAASLPHTMSEMFAYRRTLKRGQLSTISAPHAGLGLEVYAQTTSPLRRYSDLLIHQQLRAHLRGEAPLTETDILERIGAAEASAGSVRQTERLAMKHWTLVYLLRHPGWQGQGILVEERGRGYRVLIPELDLETQLHLRQEMALDSIIPLTLNGVDLTELEAHFKVSD